MHVTVHRDGPPLNSLPHVPLREGRSDVAVPAAPLKMSSAFLGAGGAAGAEPVVVVAPGNATFTPCVAGISKNGALLVSSAGVEYGLEVCVCVCV